MRNCDLKRIQIIIDHSNLYENQIIVIYILVKKNRVEWLECNDLIIHCTIKSYYTAIL